MAEAKRMSFLDHLRELRKRLWIAALFFAAAVTVSIVFRDEILAFIVDPLFRAWSAVPASKDHELKLHYGSIVSPMFVQLKLAIYAGLFFSAPMLVFQLWKFVAPGLYPRERRHVYPALIGTFFFFVGGGLFGYYVVFPFGFEFLLRYGMDLSGYFPIEPTIMIDQYMDLAIGLLFAFGLVFELPLAIVFLARIGLVDHKQLLRFSRYFIVIAFAVGAILTPTPDPLNQALMAGPLIVLYFLGTLVVVLIGKKRRKKEAEPPEPDEEPPA
ncbi:MAG: twin-arginine translocase subunit TatC [Deltaproteobacteria bacterium]|nr:twin-arginine translocase subunit TatC [Deltaproteobacteria bacterium]